MSDNLNLITVVVVIACVIVAAVIYVEYPFRTSPKLQIATTTSLYDTGLLDAIENQYQSYGVSLFFLSAGTGQAIQYAKNGDADLVLVHAPSTENTFMQVDNLGVARKIVAYNFFAIVGPMSDSAGIENKSVTNALTSIVAAGRAGNAKWISRGDNSGTHTKELSLWSKVGFTVDNLRRESWYIEAVQGMGATLTMANQMQAYTLSDIGTYLKYSKDGLINLKKFSENVKDLLNVYSVMAINPTLHPELDFARAVDFIEYLVSDAGQNFIGSYGVSDYGRPLFYPTVAMMKDNTNPTIVGWIIDYTYFWYGNQKWECPPPYRAGQDNLYL
ncbi:MAG: substrate-binding domain-containing protein [Candidatus Hadarchaeota archaeon]